jgi:hypothetical protein
VDGGHVDISRAQSGIFCAAEAGRPGHRQRHRNTRNTFPTRIYTHILNSAILGPTGGHRPVRPQGGAARAAPTVGAPRSDISTHADTRTRGHADTRTRGTFDTDTKAGRMRGARTPTHTHPPTPMPSPGLGRVEDQAAAGRARQRAAGCREGADEAVLPVLEVGQSPCGRSRSSRSHLQLLHVVVRLLLWRADGREASDARRARTRGRVAQRAAGALREGSVRVCTRGTGSAGTTIFQAWRLLLWRTGLRRQACHARTRAVAWRGAQQARCAKAALARACGARAARARASASFGVFSCGASA